jgi:hypothetical protein
MDDMHLSPENDRLFGQYVVPVNDGYEVYGNAGVMVLRTRHLSEALAAAARLDRMPDNRRDKYGNYR